MTRHRSAVSPFAVRAIALAAAVFLTHAGPAPAADAVSGRASLNAQTITLAHGLGVLGTKERSVVLGLFTAVPSPADAAAAARDGIDEAFGVNSQGKGAYVLVKLGFPDGETRADHLNVCEIDFYNFTDSPLQTMWLGADQCGVTELGGDLRPGGVVHGKMKGPREAPTGKQYTWDLDFTTTLRAGK
jgi:hypothetical protein